jgi:polyhydroxybutyrate depolymerase
MKLRSLANSAALLLTLLPCGCMRTPAGTVSEEFSFGGRSRSYLIHVPEGIDAAETVPLVLVLHGFGENAAAAVRTTGFTSLADREGFIVAFPNAVRRTWQSYDSADAALYLRGVDDVAFIAAVVDRIKQEYTIDPQRTYAAGFSNGGFMVQKIACERSDLFAGIAVVSASLTEKVAEACTPSSPVSVVMIAGTDDPIIPYNGGSVQMGPRRSSVLLSMGAVAERWAGVDACGNEPVATTLPDTDPNDGTRVSRLEYISCAGTSSVVLYSIAGGGHAWPGSPAPYPRWIVGKTSKDINGPETVWEFFKAHPKPAS